MPIEKIKQKLYCFVRDYGKYQRVNLWNLRLFAKEHKITQQNMGYAVQLLKKSGAIFYSKKYGWLAK